MIVKICGITTADDARCALQAGADWIGVNLVGGPRRLTLPAARALIAQVPDAARVVALISLPQGALSDAAPDHADPAESLEVLREAGVRRIQLYGDVRPAALRTLRRRGLQSIVVRPIDSEDALRRLEEFLSGCGSDRPDYVLLDGMHGSRLGGTGAKAPWTLLAAAHARGCYGRWPTVLLAGGLTPENVAEAVALTRVAGVDVSSGVESSPGRKDPGKIAAFISAAHGAAHF